MGHERVSFLVNVPMYFTICSSFFFWLLHACLFAMHFCAHISFFILEDGISLHWGEKFAGLCIRVVSRALDTTFALLN